MKRLKIIWSVLSQTERRIFLGSFLVFLISFSAATASFVKKNTSVIPVAGGEYREGIVGQPMFINPITIDSNDPDRDISRLVFSNLRSLAESIKADAGNRAWTVRIKENAKWHDGETLTSDDVLFTIETIQDPDANSPLYNAWQGVVAERVSAREIRFHVRTPYAFFEKNLEELLIIPKHVLGNGDVPAANLILSEYRLKPIGSGPYKFVAYSARRDGFITSFTLARNDQFVGDRPLIETIVLKFYPDEERAVDAFNSREIDGFGGVDASQIDKVRVRHDLFEVKMPAYYAIFFNTNAHPALKDKNVRLALQTAVDKNKIVDSTLKRHGAIIASPIPPGMEGYDPQLTDSVSFSHETAQNILEQGGWKIPENSQTREKKIGETPTKLEFTIVVPQIDFLVKTAEQVRDDWGKIGVKLTLNTVDPRDITESAIKTREYQMLLFGNILNGVPDLFSFWHSSERYFPGLNFALYENKTADSLMEFVRQNFDSGKRSENLTALQSLIAQDVPAVFLYSPYYLYVTTPRLGGFTTSFITTPSHRFDSVEKWYVKNARVFKN